MKLLIAFLFFIQLSVSAQDSLIVKNLYLPNSIYSSETLIDISIYKNYFDVGQPTNSTPAFSDTIKNIQRTLSSMETFEVKQNGTIPFVMRTDSTGKKNILGTADTDFPNDIQYHGNIVDNLVEIDSVSSDSLNILEKFRLKNAMQQMMGQIQSPEFVIHKGEAYHQIKVMQIPGQDANRPIKAEYIYTLESIEENVAEISISIIGKASLEEYEDVTMEGEGHIQFEVTTSHIIAYEVDVLIPMEFNKEYGTMLADFQMHLSLFSQHAFK